ncbi:hypothetical protein P152DRAFT_383245, partial [Eremomyces bilateralis CBS 781.70]
MASSTQNAPFLKELASSNKKSRDGALESLRRFLRSRAEIDEIEFQKLWKGLFFCMWMSDRAKAQQTLANDLAELVNVVPAEKRLVFLRAFWKTMAHHWTSIDALRMNKFLLLVRRYLHATFQQMSMGSWGQETLIDAHLSLLEEIPLNPSDPKVPDGMRYHVIDIYVDELDRIDESRDGSMPLPVVLRPLETLKAKTRNKTVRKRTSEALADERLQNWQSVEGDESE